MGGARHAVLAVGVVLAALLVGAADAPARGTAPEPARAPGAPGTVAAGPTDGSARVPVESPLAAVGAAVRPAAGPAAPVAVDPAVIAGPAADRRAGVLARTVPPTGPATFTVVAGEVAAPGTGPVRRVRVEVEDGLPVDAVAFGEFALEALNDPRSWGHGGAMTFARTAGDADVVVVLASPDTSARMCHPLVTRGTLSCRTGPRAVITHYRWVEGHPDYGGDLTGYRRYVVNHEVGHVLGRGHEFCPGPGELAPVMQQQTLGLRGCAPNPWAYPG